MQVAYDRIKEMMLSGDLPPGTRLVNRVLGKQLGISTVTVREALHRLTSDGLVEHVPNAGAYVRTLDAREIADLYRFREALEEFALQETIRRQDTHSLSALDATCDRMQSLCQTARDEPDGILSDERFREWLDADLTFHRQLAAAADNALLIKTLRDLDLLGRIAATKPTGIPLHEAATTYRFHREITRALRDGDLDRAIEWMRRHDGYGLDYALRHGAPS